VMAADGSRLEFPPGHVLFRQSAGWIGHPRFSPDGTMIAFESHSIAGNDDGSIDVVDLNGKHTVLSTQASVEGLAWGPDGKEVWFAGTRNAGWADTIFAITLSGKDRVILTLPQVRLYDVSKDGRALLSHETWRRQVKGFFPGDKSEHPYSWLDDTQPTAISADGRFLSMYEAGEIYYLENDSLAYYRSTDGSPPVRLGGGTPAISPDGKLVLVASNHGNGKHPLQLQPIGPGDAKELPTPGLIAFDHYAWSDDGRNIAYEGETDKNAWNVYRQSVVEGSPILVKAGGRDSFPVLSPNGDMLAVREERGGIFLYPKTGGNPTALKAASINEYPIRFVKGGKALLLAERSGGELILTIVELATGHREQWKRIAENYSSPNNQLFVATPDLKYYAYPFPRYSSVLYTVDNLR
jgi:Tol biopolymer transport system component